jgi:hypothetical protein
MFEEGIQKMYQKAIKDLKEATLEQLLDHKFYKDLEFPDDKSSCSLNCALLFQHYRQQAINEKRKLKKVIEEIKAEEEARMREEVKRQLAEGLPTNTGSTIPEPPEEIEPEIIEESAGPELAEEPREWDNVDFARVNAAAKDLSEEELAVVFENHPEANPETIINAIKNPTGKTKAALVKNKKIVKHLQQKNWKEKRIF